MRTTINKNVQAAEVAPNCGYVTVKHVIFKATVMEREHHSSLLPTITVTLFRSLSVNLVSLLSNCSDDSVNKLLAVDCTNKV